jgi:hypothetical protein
MVCNVPSLRNWYDARRTSRHLYRHVIMSMHVFATVSSGLANANTKSEVMPHICIPICNYIEHYCFKNWVLYLLPTNDWINCQNPAASTAPLSSWGPLHFLPMLEDYDSPFEHLIFPQLIYSDDRFIYLLRFLVRIKQQQPKSPILESVALQWHGHTHTSTEVVSHIKHSIACP